MNETVCIREGGKEREFSGKQHERKCKQGWISHSEKFIRTAENAGEITLAPLSFAYFLNVAREGEGSIVEKVKNDDLRRYE